MRVSHLPFHVLERASEANRHANATRAVCLSGDCWEIPDRNVVQVQNNGDQFRFKDRFNQNGRRAERLAARPLARTRADAFAVEPNVLIDNKASNRYTVIEVNARDRPGLLHALAHGLFESKLTIRSAHIATPPLARPARSGARHSPAGPRFVPSSRAIGRP